MAAKADMADEEVSSTNADQQVFKFSDAVPAMADVILNGLSYQSLASSIENPSKGPSLRNSSSSSTSSSSERASFFSAYPATASSSSEAFSSPENSLCSGSPHSTATSTSSHSSAKREPASKCIINIDKVKVLVRMRPFFEYEKVCPLRQVLCLLGNKIMVKEHVAYQKGPKSRSFNQLELEVDYVQDDSYVQVDQVEKKEEAQRQMYSTIGAPAVHNVLNGQTVTILSYGQAGTGKTYTIYGDGTQEGNGLMPRMASELLQHVKNKCMDQECRVEVSYLEIYQEKLRDLLASSHSKDSSVDLVRMQSPEWSTGSVETSSSGEQDEEMRSISSDSETMASVTSETMRNNDVIKAHVQSPQQVSGFFFGGPSKSSGNYLRLREHPVRGTYVEGLLWKKVSRWSEMDQLLRHGMASRTTVATDTNSHSSRSHTLFTMKITWVNIPTSCLSYHFLRALQSHDITHNNFG